MALLALEGSLTPSMANILATSFDLAAVDDAAAVGKQDDLDEHGGVESRCAVDVIVVAFVEGGQIEFVIDQVA